LNIRKQRDHRCRHRQSQIERWPAGVAESWMISPTRSCARSRSDSQ